MEIPWIARSAGVVKTPDVSALLARLGGAPGAVLAANF